MNGNTGYFTGFLTDGQNGMAFFSKHLNGFVGVTLRIGTGAEHEGFLVFHRVNLSNIVVKLTLSLFLYLSLQRCKLYKMEIFLNTFLVLLGALFSVLNPIGVIPFFVGLTQDYDKAERSRVSLMTAVNVCIILLISFFVGEYVLRFFGITISALRIAGGILIASSGFGLLNANPKKRKGISKEVEEDLQHRSSISLTPLAMPMLAGPGSISLLIAFNQDHHSTPEILSSVFSIVIVSLLIFLILRSAHYLAKYLGASGIVAISRIVGFLTVAIGIQYIISAVLSIIRGI